MKSLEEVCHSEQVEGALIAESEQVLCPAAVLIIGRGSLLTAQCQGHRKKKMRETTEQIPGEKSFKPSQENNNWLIRYQTGYNNDTHLVKDSLANVHSLHSPNWTYLLRNRYSICNKKKDWKLDDGKITGINAIGKKKNNDYIYIYIYVCVCVIFICLIIIKFHLGYTFYWYNALWSIRRNKTRIWTKQKFKVGF